MYQVIVVAEIQRFGERIAQFLVPRDEGLTPLDGVLGVRQCRAVPGSRMACSLCDLPVQSETYMQLYFRNGGAMYHLHVRCFMVWEIERHNGRGSAAV